MSNKHNEEIVHRHQSTKQPLLHQSTPSAVLTQHLWQQDTARGASSRPKSGTGRKMQLTTPTHWFSCLTTRPALLSHTTAPLMLPIHVVNAPLQTQKKHVLCYTAELQIAACTLQYLCPLSAASHLPSLLRF